MKLPPRLYNDKGELRKVGFELEFSGLKLIEASQVLVSLFDGELEQLSPYKASVKTARGTYIVEFDSTFYKEKRYEKYLNAIGLNPKDSTVGKKLEDALARLGEIVIPFEIVTP